MTYAPTNSTGDRDDQTAKVKPANYQSDYGESKHGHCFSCRQRIGLIGFKYFYSNNYCGLRQYAEEHDFSLDYKTHGKEYLQVIHFLDEILENLLLITTWSDMLVF